MVVLGGRGKLALAVSELARQDIGLREMFRRKESFGRQVENWIFGCLLVVMFGYVVMYSVLYVVGLVWGWIVG